MPPDEILCGDLDLFVDVGLVERSAWLRRAKREALLQYLAGYIRDIWEATERDDGSADGILAAFVGGENIPAGYGALDAKFYDAQLSAAQVEHWRELAHLAARRDDEGAPGVVYFISIGDASLVKIGFTVNLRHRLRALRTASPCEPVVHLMLPGSLALEAELKKRFAAHQVAREWFRLTEEVLAFIEEQRGRQRPP